MAGSEGHHHDAPSPALHICRANDRVFRIVAALDDHVGLEMPDEVQRRVIRENYDKIYALEGRQHVSTLGVAAHRACGSFETAHGFIAVDADDERVRGLARGAEDIDMAGMKQVENAIGECYPTLRSSSPPLSLSPCRNLRRGISRLQSPLSTDGWK